MQGLHDARMLIQVRKKVGQGIWRIIFVHHKQAT